MTDKPFWMQLRDAKLKAGKVDNRPDKKGSPASLKEQEKEKEEADKEEKPIKNPHPAASAKKYKKKIKQVSKKRAKENRKYAPRKKKFLEENPSCQMQLEGCTGMATELHHKAGRSGKQLIKVDDFCAACHNCHTKATQHSRQAIADGHSKTRLGKPTRE